LFFSQPPPPSPAHHFSNYPPLQLSHNSLVTDGSKKEVDQAATHLVFFSNSNLKKIPNVSLPDQLLSFVNCNSFCMCNDSTLFWCKIPNMLLSSWIIKIPSK
jgi:hypothetical protein